MKKLLMFGLLAMVLVLGACNKKEEVTNEKEPATQETVAKEPEEKYNELTYEVNGEKKTVSAKPQTFEEVEFKLPEDFTSGLNENSIEIKPRDTNDFIITFSNQSFTIGAYELLYYGADATKIEKPEKIGYENIDKNFDFVIKADTPEDKLITIVKNPEQPDTLAVTITIKNDKYSEELEAKILAMVDSIEF